MSVSCTQLIFFLDLRLFFSKPDIEIPGGSEKKTGQTVIEDCTWAVDYENIRGDWI